MNLFIYAFIITITLILVILTFPFRFYLKIDGYTLKLYLYKLKVLEFNLKNELEQATSNIKQTLLENEITKDLLIKIITAYGSPLKVFYKVKIKYIKILYHGYQGDHVVSPLLFASSHALASNIGAICYINNIPFYYSFRYSNEVKFKFSSMIYFTLGTLIEEMWRIRGKKCERTSTIFIKYFDNITRMVDGQRLSVNHHLGETCLLYQFLK